MHFGEPCADTLSLVELHLLFVGLVAGNQRALAGKVPGPVQSRSLRLSADRDLSHPAALGPGGLQP